MKHQTVDTWLFDLDNTLYSAKCGLFDEVRARIGTYMVTHCGLSPVDAAAAQRSYRDRFGSTLAGLMAEKAIEPDHFLSFVHDVNYDAIQPDPRLGQALAGLPGRLYIFTNGSRDHAVQVTDRLGITGAFDDIFDIARADYVPKPNPAPYDKIVHDLGLAARATAFVEDIERNLVPAKKMGMTTVLVSEGVPEKSNSVDHIVSDLPGWLAAYGTRPS
ncbi:MAG: pyrimidine 5'-nucleotidase [Alphaproteobacteria bacterium]|jgi:putative hydrolase of the HAD superfamily